MSKYIRTKDRIYERMFPDCETQRISFDHKTIEPAYFTTNYEWVAQKDVIKQADAVKELCDELVEIDLTGNDEKRPYIVDAFNMVGYNTWFKRNQESIRTGNKIVYGEIWVNGELHKAAQMNDEGDLKLL